MVRLQMRQLLVGVAVASIPYLSAQSVYDFIQFNFMRMLMLMLILADAAHRCYKFAMERLLAI